MKRFSSNTLVKILLGCTAAAILSSAFYLDPGRNQDQGWAPDAPISLAVLGDSDSHSYHDHLMIPETTSSRGGKLRPVTWQWTEVLARLRGRYIDEGEWGIWGMPVKLAEILDRLGWGGRAPRKEDYRFNFAVSGAECSDLMTGYYRQAPRLVALMDQEPTRWAAGVVSIRIGVNTLGKTTDLDRFAREGATPAVKLEVTQCVDWIRQAVALIRQRHPQTRFVLVGIFDNANWAPDVGRWQSAQAHGNIVAVLDIFDDALRRLVEGDTHMAFFDDRAWFRKYWGDRGPDGRPVYGQVNFGGRVSVTNTQGDEPVHATVTDGHAGSVWNELWAKDFIALLNAAFGANIPPLSTEEIVRFVDADGTFGLKPR